MDPQIVLSRGYWEYADQCRDQWIAAYKEIAKKHPKCKAQAFRMMERIELACSLSTTHARFYNSGNVDECFYAEAVARENEYLEKTQKAQASLDGDFPCGNEEDMRFARRLFSIREMAFLQMGLASEIDPDNLNEMPPFDKPFSDEAFPTLIETADQPKGRKGFIHECLGRLEEAIACYEAIGEGRPDDRIRRLRRQLPLAAPDAIVKLAVKHFHRAFWSQSDLEEYHDYTAVGLGTGDLPKGFAWIDWDMRFSGAYEPLSRYYIGLVDETLQMNEDLDEKVPVLRCGVKYELRGSSQEAVVYLTGEFTDELLVETDDEERVTFCGMHCNGKRHGLGSEFFYQDDEILEVRGLWQQGQFTHRYEDGKLVPCGEESLSLPHDFGL